MRDLAGRRPARWSPSARLGRRGSVVVGVGLARARRRARARGEHEQRRTSKEQRGRTGRAVSIAVQPRGDRTTAAWPRRRRRRRRRARRCRGVSRPSGPGRARARGDRRVGRARARRRGPTRARVVVDDAALRDPPRDGRPSCTTLWATRTPVVVDLRVAREALSAPETDDRPALRAHARVRLRARALLLPRRAPTTTTRATATPRWGAAAEARAARRADRRPGRRAAPRRHAGVVRRRPAHRRARDRRRRAASCTASRSSRARCAPTSTRSTSAAASPASRPTSGRRCCTRAGRRGSSRPPGRARPPCSRPAFRHLVVERGYGAASVCALAYNRRAGAEMQDRLGDLPARRAAQGPHAQLVRLRDRAPGPARACGCIDEREIRNRIEPHLTLRFRANTDALRPVPRSARRGAARAALARARRAAARRRRGLRRDVRALPRRARARRRHRLRRADRGRDRGAAARARRCARALQRECRHLLVDEFQDLRPAHLLLVRLVAAPAYDVFGVGDDDQVIYGYSGADPGFLINFADYFPGAADHPLEVNYRCPPPVVDGARMLLAHNRRRVDKVMRAGARAPTPTSPSRVAGRAADRARTIAPHATDLIEAWLQRRARRPSRSRCCAASTPGCCRCRCSRTTAACRSPPRSASSSSAAPACAARSRTSASRARSPTAASCAAPTSAEVARRPNRRITAKRHRRDAQPPALDAVDAARPGRRARTRPTPTGSTSSPTISTASGELVAGDDAAAVLRSIRDDVGLGAAMGTLDNSGRGRDASHLDDVTALLAIAAVHPDPATFEPWLREHLQGVTVGDDPRARRAGDALDRAPGEGPGVGPGDRARRARRAHAAPPHRRHRGGAPRVPRRAHPVPRRRWCCSPTRPRPRRSSTSSRPPPGRVASDRAETRLERSRRTAPPGHVHARPRTRPTSSTRCGPGGSNGRRADGVPAYVVLHDATINEIAAAQPGVDAGALPHLGHRPHQARALRRRHPRDRRYVKRDRPADPATVCRSETSGRRADRAGGGSSRSRSRPVRS